MATVYQHSTLAALMAGLLGGTITVGELKEHGDTGIGTLHGVDGEVIILNGEVYQAESSGKVNHITDMSTLVPFATVHQAHGPESKAITLNPPGAVFWYRFSQICFQMVLLVDLNIKFDQFRIAAGPPASAGCRPSPG